MEKEVTEQTTTLAFRLVLLEQSLSELKKQLDHYVPSRENDLQLNYIRGTAERIEKEVAGIKEQLGGVVTKLSTQESDVRQQGAEDREASAALQVKVLWGIVSLVLGAIVSVLVGYVTHFFH